MSSDDGDISDDFSDDDVDERMLAGNNNNNNNNSHANDDDDNDDDEDYDGEDPMLRRATAEADQTPTADVQVKGSVASRIKAKMALLSRKVRARE